MFREVTEKKNWLQATNWRGVVAMPVDAGWYSTGFALMAEVEVHEVRTVAGFGARTGNRDSLAFDSNAMTPWVVFPTRGEAHAYLTEAFETAENKAMVARDPEMIHSLLDMYPYASPAAAVQEAYRDGLISLPERQALLGSKA